MAASIETKRAIIKRIKTDPKTASRSLEEQKKLAASLIEIADAKETESTPDFKRLDEPRIEKAYKSARPNLMDAAEALGGTVLGGLGVPQNLLKTTVLGGATAIKEGQIKPLLEQYYKSVSPAWGESQPLTESSDYLKRLGVLASTNDEYMTPGTFSNSQGLDKDLARITLGSGLDLASSFVGPGTLKGGL